MSKVLVIVDFKKATAEQYDASLKDLTDSGQLHLATRPHHFAGLQDGGIFVVDVWESEQDFHLFGSIMIPIILKNGIEAPHVTILPLHNELH